MPQLIGGTEVPHPAEIKAGWWPHGRTEADRAWAMSLERRDAVAEQAPALPMAWTLIETANLRGAVVPIDMTSLAPAGEPFADATAAVDWYDVPEHRGHGAGLRTGPQGGWGIVALRVKSWASWASWVQANAIETVPVFGGKYEDKKVNIPVGDRRGDQNHDYVVRPLGVTTRIAWEPATDPDPFHLPTVITTRGNGPDARQFARLRHLRDLTTADAGGWWLWCVRADSQGRLPTFRSRSLSEDLAVVPTNGVIPVAGTRDGRRIVTHGSFTPDERDTGWLPPWLASRFGARF